jgi:DNA-binding MarR family transcriptional regulator
MMMNIHKDKKLKSSKQLERHVKGIANHWRISMLLLIKDKHSLSLDGIAEGLHMNIKTTSDHARRLAQAGLIEKRYAGRTVEHSLSPYGKIFVNFLTTFRHS